MRNWRNLLVFLMAHLATFQIAASAHGVPISSRIGWQAELSTLLHDVSGTVTIIDEDTLRVDDFTYDGKGRRVHWVLAPEDTEVSFSGGLKISENIKYTAYDGTQGPIFLHLPKGATLDRFHAVSVYCTRVQVNFGSGEFEPVPEPTTLCLCGVAVLGLSTRRRL